MSQSHPRLEALSQFGFYNMIVLFGIDDTDNKTSRGTGYQARRLGEALTTKGLAELRSVTRHQLLIDPRIPYTSRNSSACLVLEVEEESLSGLRDFASVELRHHSASDSDAGIAIAPQTIVDSAVKDFGYAAKDKILSAEAAYELARQRGIIIEGLLGHGEGVIGALAAVGLHTSGSDGRFIWLPELRNLSGTYSVQYLTRVLGVELLTQTGEPLPLTAEINLGDWVRPVMRHGRATLLVEEEDQNGQIGWKLIDKSVVKTLSG